MTVGKTYLKLEINMHHLRGTMQYRQALCPKGVYSNKRLLQNWAWGVPGPHPRAKFHPCGVEMWIYSPQNRQSWYFYREACAQRSHADIVFTQWSKNGFFAPQGWHVAPINVKFGTGERTPPVGMGERTCGPLPQISLLLGQTCGDTATKTGKISNFGHKFAPQGRLECIFNVILSICTRW